MRSPSFNDLLDWAIKYREKNHPVWKYNSKTNGRALAEELGIRIPELLGGPAALQALEFPDRAFVVKPVNGAASRGVFPLIPKGGGNYLNLFHGATTTRAEVYEAGLASKKITPGHPDEVKHPWIIEELITRESGTKLAYDWKFFVIGGKTELVWQTDHNLGNGGSRGCKWWTTDWKDAGEAAPSKTRRIDPELPPPLNGAGLLETAARVGARIAGPLVRVDLYETEHGEPVFGEITPHHGGGTLPFLPEWDRRLGIAWLKTGMTM